MMRPKSALCNHSSPTKCVVEARLVTRVDCSMCLGTIRCSLLANLQLYPCEATPEQLDDRVPCPFCGRKFGEEQVGEECDFYISRIYSKIFKTKLPCWLVKLGSVINRTWLILSRYDCPSIMEACFPASSIWRDFWWPTGLKAEGLASN